MFNLRKDYLLCSTIHPESGSEQENTEFLTRGLVRVNKMKRLGISISHNMFEVSTHIHKLLRTRPEPRRYNTGSDGDTLHSLEDCSDAISGAAASGESVFTAVTEGGPERDGTEGAVRESGIVGRSAAFECDTDEPVPHFTDEVVSREREFEEEGWFGGQTIVLDAEPNVASTITEDGSDYH